MSKIEKINEVKAVNKPFSPRLQRLFNKSTFIDRILTSKTSETAYTTRYDPSASAKVYDPKIFKQRTLKTPAILMSKAVSLKKLPTERI